MDPHFDDPVVASTNAPAWHGAGPVLRAVAAAVLAAHMVLLWQVQVFALARIGASAAAPQPRPMASQVQVEQVDWPSPTAGRAVTDAANAWAAAEAANLLLSSVRAELGLFRRRLETLEAACLERDRLVTEKTAHPNRLSSP